MNHILVFKMDNPRRLAKYECILNDEITIREHFIQILGKFLNNLNQFLSYR